MTLNTFIVVVVVYLASNAELPSMAAPLPEPSDFYADSPLPSPKGVAYLETCVKKLTEKCGNEVFSGVFVNTPVTKECCKNLEKMGKLCHLKIVSTLLNVPLVQATSTEKSEILSKSDYVWSQCVSVGHVIGAAVSPSYPETSF
ncbi:unnamed protein product [Ilex paraguariensis]|uniref:Prolamin-like domain-containing protein n=1 Tax=Ilex paraguariensis TaxID=185542 RepID=A0ABC8SY82_9AQUA